MIKISQPRPPIIVIDTQCGRDAATLERSFERQCSVKASGGWQGANTVLVIDDEAALRQVTGRLLERLGFRVLVASDGATGLQLFREQESQIICVVADVTMPGMSGTEVARQIRISNPYLPLILMSGYTQEEVVKTLTNIMPINFLSKPFNLVEMRDVLQQAFALGQIRQHGEK